MSQKRTPKSLISYHCDDMEHLKHIARKMLQHVEDSLDILMNAQGDIIVYHKTHELIYGPKASLSSTLTTLSDLLLKLEQHKTTPNAPDNTLVASLTLSSADVAIVEAFVSKTSNLKPQT